MKVVDESTWTEPAAPTDKVLAWLAAAAARLIVPNCTQYWPAGAETLRGLREPWVSRYVVPPTSARPHEDAVLLDVDQIPGDVLPERWRSLRGTGAGIYATLTGYGPPRIEPNHAAYAARLAAATARMTEERISSGLPLEYPVPIVGILAAADQPGDELRVRVSGAGYRPFALDLIGLRNGITDAEDGALVAVTVERRTGTDDAGWPRYRVLAMARYRVDRTARLAERWIGSELERSGRYVGARVETLYLTLDDGDPL